MAEKILGIKLNIDTTDGAKFATITKEMATSVETVTKATDKLASHEAERIALLEKQNNAYAKLQNIVLNANNAIIEGTRGANLGWGNAERAVTRYNAVISETKDRLIALNAEQQRMIVLASQASAGAMASGGRASSTSNFVDQDRQAVLRAARDARAAAEPISASSITAASGGGLGSYTATGSANARLEAARATSNALAETERQTNARLLAEFQRYDQQARDLYAIHNGSRIRMEQEANNRMAALHTEALAMDRTRTAAAASTAAHTAAVNQNSQALQTNVVQHQSLLVRIAEVMGAYKLLNLTLQYTKQALLDIPKAGLEQQVTESSLLGIFGTEKTASNLAFVKEVADEAGQSLVVLEQAYRRYAPSAMLAGASMEKVNKSFKDFAEVGTILHLPEEKINSLFLALDQMFAKGVVQSEEVKKQLGNVLPGAVEAFAQSMGKTPAAFMESMKANEVIAREAVPIFAAHYRKIFGGADDSVFTLTKDRLQSNLNRLQTAYTEMDRAIFAETKETMNAIVKEAAVMVNAVGGNIKGIIQAVEILTVVITTRLVGVAIRSAIVGFDAMAAAASRTLVMITGLAAPELAFAATIVYLTGKVTGLGVAYEKATGFLVTYHEKSYGLVNFLTSVWDEDISLATGVINKFSSAIEYLGDKFSWLKTIMEKTGEASNSFVSYFAGLDVYKNVAIRTAIKDQRDLINSFEDTKKSKKDLDKAIAEGKFDSLDKTFKGIPYKTPEQTTQSNIEEAKTKMLLVAEAEHGVLPDEEPFGMSNANTTKAMAKQEALLKQANATIKSEGDKKIAELERQKAAVENSMVTIDGKVATPELQGRQQVQDIELKILSIKREVTRATELATMASEKENAILEAKSLLLNKNKEAIYAAVRFQETGTKSDTQTDSGAKGRFGGIGAEAVGGSATDKSRGSMQITEGAWKDTGRQASEFAGATMVELGKAGREYLDLMLRRFKDLDIALAAYNQGSGSVSALYKKTGVTEGSVDPEDLAKVKGAFTPLQKKYVTETESRMPITKGSIIEINQQTTLNKLKAEEAVQDTQIAQKKEKSNNDNIIYLSNYRKGVQELQAQALAANGEVEAAEKLKTDLKYQQLRLDYAGNEEALKYIATIQQGVIGTTLITKAEEHLRNVQKEVADAEASINIEREAGLITYDEAARKIVDVKRKVLSVEYATLDVMKQQVAVGNKARDLPEKIAGLQTKIGRGGLDSTALQNKIIAAGDPSGLIAGVGSSLADQASINQNKQQDIDAINLKAKHDPTMTAKKQQEEITAIKEKATRTELSSQLQMYASISDAGAKTFSLLTSQMIKMYGARSTQARLAFAAEKAMQISSVIMHTAAAVMAAMDLPTPFNMIMAGIVAATGAVQLATVIAQPMPQAHAGLTNVPADQTYLLSAGERVLAPQQNKDLTKALSDGTMGGSKKQQQPHTTKIINVFDPSIVGQYMNTPQGETLIMNTVRRNQAA